MVVTSCIDEFKEFTANVCNIDYILLTYLLRHELLAPDAARDPSGDYNSLNQEAIALAQIIKLSN